MNGKLSKLSDGELIDCYRKNGREEYADELLVRYLPLVYGYFLNYASADNAAPLVKDFFAELRPVLKSGIEAPSGFRNWLYLRTVNFITEKGGKTLSPGFNLREIAFIRSLASGDPAAVSQYEQALPRLNRSQKECIRRFFFEGMSFSDVASEAGLLLNNIRSYIESGVKIVTNNSQEGETV